MEKVNKRRIFQDYLLKKLGFNDDIFEFDYVEFRLKNSHDRYMIRSLLDECDLKKNSTIKSKQLNKKYISATDISNFTYCKASYAISKTYELPKSDLAKTGTEQHDISPIIRTFEYIPTGGDKPSEGTILEKYVTEKNKIFFDDLKQSTILFSGHNSGDSKERVFFRSTKGNYVGQPDYIFKNNSDNHFVVEEKFQYQYDTSDESDKISFHHNHINQTISYLHGIPDFNIQYGYLVYWKYNISDGRVNVHSCYVRKIVKSEVTRVHITAIFVDLKKFLESGVTDFDVAQRTANRCANCAVTVLCGHKTGSFDKLEIPYSKKYWKLKFVPFPKELIKPPEGDVQSIQ